MYLNEISDWRNRSGEMVLIGENLSQEFLIDAVRKGDKEVIKACVVSDDALSFDTWKNGYKILNYALAYKEYEIALMLLDKVKNVNNPTDKIGRTPLHYAAKANKTIILKRLLLKGADTNVIDDHDMTPLHYAVIMDHIECVKMLLEFGAIPNEIRDYVFRFTAFQHACKSSKHEILQYFLDHGCDANEVFKTPDSLISPENSSPLHMAITQRNLDSIILLLNHNADVNHANIHKETCLHLACRENSEEIVRLLISKNAEINVECKNGVTPLHIAVRNGNIEIVKMLLENGSNIDCQDKEGKIPLQLAVQDRYKEIVDCLLEINHDVNYENNRKAFKHALLETGFRSEICKYFIQKHDFVVRPEEMSELAFAAVKKGYFHIMENLLENLIPTTSTINLIFDARDEEGDTLLHCATKNNQHDIVRLLISKKADVQAINNEGNQAIIYAIENENENIIKTFLTTGNGAKNYSLLLHSIIQLKKNKCGKLLELALQYNVDVNQHDYDLQGMTALHLICRESMKNDVELAELLLRKGADINVTTDEGSTVLHMAAREDGQKLVEALLKYEPNLNVKDSSGHTPLHLAATRACSTIVSLLLDAGADVNIENNLKMTPVDIAHSVKNSLPPRNNQPNQRYADEASEYETRVKECISHFSDQIAKLFVAKLRLHENNKKYIKNNAEFIKYMAQCEHELEDMQNCSINSYITIYDIFTKNIRKTVRYTREDNARSSLEQVDLKGKYPIYGSMIDKMKNAVMREYEVNKAKDSINILTGYGLPDSCTENIFIYLRTKELKNLSIATNFDVDMD